MRSYVPRIQLQWLADDPLRTFLELDGSVVFVDISGFTRLSERLARRGKEGAEQVTDTIGTCFTDLLGVAYESGGSLLKFGGDALLLLFWGEEHVARACRAAVLMRRTLRDVGRIDLPGAKVTLRMSVGINSGRFHFFLVGGSHREFLVSGPAATRTVLMEQTAEAGEIVVSPETASALPARVLGTNKGPGVLLRREPPRSPPPTEADVAVPGDDICVGLPVALREHVGSGAFGSEHRPVTVAFVHYEGTDALIRDEGPRAAAAALDELVRDVQVAVDEQGVCFLGSDVDADGGKLILTAGAPRVLGEDEERMLLALRRIVEADRRLPVRIGVNHGAVFSGDVGPAYRRTYTVMGDTVNLAARLMAKAPAGEIYSTASVLDRSNTRFETTELEPFMVKGKTRPVRAWSVGRAVGSRGREAVSAQRFPFVGRPEELAVLGSALASATAGTGGLVELVGEPGIGKTRLMEELLVRARSDRPRVLHAICEAYTSSTPYAVWRDLLRQAVGLGWEDPAPEVLDHLRKLIEERAPELLPWLPLVAIPFDADAPSTPEVEQLAPEFRRQKLHEVVLAFVRGQLRDPLLVEIEDAHLMDEASADLLAALAGRTGEAPWLVVVTRRGEGGFVAPEGAGVTRIELDPLEPGDILELARAATEAEPLPPHIMSMVTERSAGNPQFLLDLARAAASDASRLPDSVEAAAMIQIDQLAPDDRAVVRRASVLGVSFHLRLLEEMFDEGERLPDEATWVRLGGLFEDEDDGYRRFRRAVVRDAAYARLPFRTRRRLHGIAGARLEREAGEEADEAAGVLSLHFFLAEEHAKAWRYARIAGDRAGAIYANVEAARFYQRALEAGRRAEVATEALLRVAEALGDVRFRAGLFDDAAKAFADARKLCGEDPVGQAQLMYKRGLVEEHMGRFPRALRWIGRGRRMVESTESTEAARLAARLSARYSAVLYAEGRMADATRWARRAVGDAEAAGAQEAVAEALNILGAADVMLGRPEAEEHWRRAERIYEELGDLPGQATLGANLGALAYFAGRWDEALELYARAREARERSGDPVNAATCSMNVAEVLLDQGRSAEAESILLDVARVYRASGDQYDLGVCLAFRGRAALRAGRVGEAQALFEEARAEFEYVGARGDIVEVEARAVECLLFTGEPGRAVAWASALLERAQAEGGVAVLTPHLERVRGYASAQLGDLAVAREALEASLAAARARGADHEVALTLQAILRLHTLDAGGVPKGAVEESGAILDRLCVIAVPAVPLPPRR